MLNRIEALTAEFQPISLDELNQRASLQTRADNKYFLPWHAFVDFTTTLQQTHVVLEIDGQRAFAYDTQYFDTPDLMSYWSHIQGRRKRFKCRSRQYMNSGLCVFELKLKGGRGETIKHKIGYDQDALATVTPAADTFLKEYLSEAYGVKLTAPMVPSLRTFYRRVTFMAKNSAERVTCDLSLAFAAGDQQWQAQMADDYVLIEIKSARGRSASDQLLWRMGVRPAGGSKYCLGLSLVRPELRSNPFHTIRKKYFVRNGEPQVERAPVQVVPVEPVHTAVSMPALMPTLG